MTTTQQLVEVRRARLARTQPILNKELAAMANARTRAIAAREHRRWMNINPAWTEHGPELLLTSRGQAVARTVGQIDAGAAGVAVGTMLVGGLVTFGMTYLACRLAMRRR